MLAHERPSEPSTGTTPHRPHPRRGGPTPPGPPVRAATLPEVLLVPAIVLLLLAIGLPVIAEGRRDANAQASMNNLVTLGVAHAIYAAEWNGRQVSVIVDDISSYGPGAGQAFGNYNEDHDEPHPPLYLGWGFTIDGTGFGLWRYSMMLSGNVGLVQPIVFNGADGFPYLGFCRMMNTRPLHGYVTGRFYDPVYYPPGDHAPYDVVEPAFDRPDEWVDNLGFFNPNLGDMPMWPGYCLSPAAYFHPDVMRNPDAGGWQNPWSIDHGFETPGLHQAHYPALKTQMLEHHWIQNAPPEPCIPDWWTEGTYAGCEPWYFNHGYDSAPAAIFYDMSVRLLPNADVLADDERLIEETGYGLWSRDTPFQEDGYRGEYAYDGIRLSHHILTTDGIRGRDTLTVPGGLRPFAESGRESKPVGPGARPRFPRRAWERADRPPPSIPDPRDASGLMRMDFVPP